MASIAPSEVQPRGEGHTFIITNAMNGWVEYSAAKWVPELLPVLQKVPHP